MNESGWRTENVDGGGGGGHMEFYVSAIFWCPTHVIAGLDSGGFVFLCSVSSSRYGLNSHRSM